MATTYQIFADFPDHRVTARCIYSISDLLTISLLTYLCGGEDYVDMSEFAHVRARDFNLLTDNDCNRNREMQQKWQPERNINSNSSTAKSVTRVQQKR